MKASRELKLYISRFRKELKAICFDDTVTLLKMNTCKKNKNRAKDKQFLFKEINLFE